MTKTTAPAKSNQGIEKEFCYTNPRAAEVLLVGDFTDWSTNAVAMQRTNKGEWKAKVVLRPGRHEYRFLVDGNWINDPACLERRLNPHGSENSVCDVNVTLF